MLSLIEFNEMLKVPILIKHFTEHQSQKKDLSFIEFLTMHYVQTDGTDSDNDKDMQLPFKSHIGCIGDITFTFAANTYSTNFAHHAVIESVFTEYVSSFIDSSHLSSIWQPPKLC